MKRRSKWRLSGNFVGIAFVRAKYIHFSISVNTGGSGSPDCAALKWYFELCREMAGQGPSDARTPCCGSPKPYLLESISLWVNRYLLLAENDFSLLGLLDDIRHFGVFIFSCCFLLCCFDICMDLLRSNLFNEFQ